MSKLGLRSARKLTLAGIKISLIELRSCELCQRLALPELKKAELRAALYIQSIHVWVACMGGVYGWHVWVALEAARSS